MSTARDGTFKTLGVLLGLALVWSHTSAAQSACNPDQLISPPERRITSQGEWDAHVRNIVHNDSPLSHLPPFARKQFVRRVNFNERGLTGLSFDVLEQELTLSQAYRVLALVGAEGYIRLLKNIRIDTALDRQLRSCLNTAN